jgi:hypothetical protein
MKEKTENFTNLNFHQKYAFSDNGHLSNKKTYEFLKIGNVSEDCKIILMHQSNQHGSEKQNDEIKALFANRVFELKKLQKTIIFPEKNYVI